MQNSDLAANIIRLRFMAICELLLRQMYGPSSGVLRMDADNDRSLWLNTNAETIGQKRHA